MNILTKSTSVLVLLFSYTSFAQSQSVDFGDIGPNFSVGSLELQNTHEIIQTDSTNLLDGKPWISGRDFQKVSKEYNKKARALGYQFKDLFQLHETEPYQTFLKNKENQMLRRRLFSLSDGWQVKELKTFGGKIVSFEVTKLYETTSLEAILKATEQKFGTPDVNAKNRNYYYGNNKSGLRLTSYSTPEEAEIGVVNNSNAKNEKLDYYIVVDVNRKKEGVKLTITASAPQFAKTWVQGLDKRIAEFAKEQFEEKLLILQKEAKSTISL